MTPPKRKKIQLDGYDYWLEKIDSTHFYFSNSEGMRGFAHHVAQHHDRPYYEEIRAWLKEAKNEN